MNDHARDDRTFDDDAALTAYALGELDDEQRAALERRTAADPHLARELAAIESTVHDLEDALADEPAPGLTDAQRRAIESGPAPARLVFTKRTFWTGAGLAAAACVTVALIWGPQWWGRDHDDVVHASAPTESLESAEIDGRLDKSAGLASGAARNETDGDDAILSFRAEMKDELAEKAPGVDRRAGAESERRREGPSRSLRSADEGLAAREAGGRRIPPPVVTRPAPTAPPAALSLPRETAAPARARMQHDRGGAPAESEPALEPGVGGAGAVVDAERGAVEAPTGESFARLEENDFKDPMTPGDDKSTFSIDVDTAAYANIRRMLGENRLPPADAVRIEEMINYFDYDYPEPTGDDPFSVNVETGPCPWNDANRLVRIGLKGRDVEADMRPATNLVFLIDVSGSMNNANKLPLLKRSMALLLDNLVADDRVAIVVYANAEGLVLPSTYCDEKGDILQALENLRAGGSTNGGAGIELAYQVAQDHFIEGGVNRVILCTDGDFNVGVTGDALVRLVEAKKKGGVHLSVLGFGTGNFKDDMMEKISNKGDGNFSYIDSFDEAKKVLVEDMVGTLVTIAKDVKIQVEFNPAKVRSYRLVGYANRMLANRDFEDDTKDAGEIGAGHTVTALYEIVPVDPAQPRAIPDDDSKYVRRSAEVGDSPELLTVALRYKAPEARDGGDRDVDKSVLIEQPVLDDGRGIGATSDDFRLAAAVASFGLVLRDSTHKGTATFETVAELLRPLVDADDDERGRLAELAGLVQKSRTIKARTDGGV